MQKSKKLSLSLVTQSTSTKTPLYKILVNGVGLGNPVERIETKPMWHTDKFIAELTEINDIEVHLLNKESNDTKLVDNEIVEDLLLIIEKIDIDGIDLTNKLSKIANYVDTAGKRHYTHTYITFNGCMKIRIHKNLLYTDWLAGLL